MAALGSSFIATDAPTATAANTMSVFAAVAVDYCRHSTWSLARNIPDFAIAIEEVEQGFA
ncbi:hypothetical protein ACFV0H_33225 [Streptomyces erythrochromogenes]|uniref:Uncharacterized protein n=1 Tax=Streptomyces erythrochromogenes TaxID=285574 RepID=A0ABZ1QMR1_9ACTN|nr:hypothetical protein [Streptomyces erythrochromogenes]